MSNNEMIDSFEDADMTDGSGEKVVTMVDVLQEQKEFEEDANAVLGASDEKNCTYSKGYIKRQAIYACITCCGDAKDDNTKRAGVCLACSLNCHENHELVELYTKRNFRCDCGNQKFNSHPCQFFPEKTDLNDENYYNQNFSGLYCTCHRPYPDPDSTFEDEMIQCIICEDWLHASHLETTVPTNEQYAEMVCKGCMEKNEFLHDYSEFAINNEDPEINILSVSTTELTPNNDSNDLNTNEEGTTDTSHKHVDIIKDANISDKNESQDVSMDVDDSANMSNINTASDTNAENNTNIIEDDVSKQNSLGEGEQLIDKQDTVTSTENENAIEERLLMNTSGPDDEDELLNEETNASPLTSEDIASETNDNENTISDAAITGTLNPIENTESTEKEIENTISDVAITDTLNPIENTESTEKEFVNTISDVAITDTPNPIENTESTEKENTVTSGVMENNDQTTEENSKNNQTVETDESVSTDTETATNKNNEPIEPIQHLETSDNSKADNKPLGTDSMSDAEEPLTDQVTNNTEQAKIEGKEEGKNIDPEPTGNIDENTNSIIEENGKESIENKNVDEITDVETESKCEENTTLNGYADSLANVEMSSEIKSFDNTTANKNEDDLDTEIHLKESKIQNGIADSLTNVDMDSEMSCENISASNKNKDDVDIVNKIEDKINNGEESPQMDEDMSNETRSYENSSNIDNESKLEKSKIPNGKADTQSDGAITNETRSDENMSASNENKDDELNTSTTDKNKNITENKRKLSTEDSEDITAVKKVKVDAQACIRPKTNKKRLKGATFWPFNFRQKLCTCNQCITMYKDLSVLFLIDPEDTVTAYETLGKEKNNGTASSQYEKGLEALSSLDRTQQINALTEYNKMKDKLLDFLKSFKDRKEIVKEEDIKQFFAGMKLKREPDGVYFCR